MSFESGSNSSNDDYCGVPPPSLALSTGHYTITHATVPPSGQPPLPAPLVQRLVETQVEIQNLASEYPEPSLPTQPAQGVSHPNKGKRASRRGPATLAKKRKAKNA